MIPIRLNVYSSMHTAPNRLMLILLSIKQIKKISYIKPRGLVWLLELKYYTSFVGERSIEISVIVD